MSKEREEENWITSAKQNQEKEQAGVSSAESRTSKAFHHSVWRPIRITPKNRKG